LTFRSPVVISSTSWCSTPLLQPPWSSCYISTARFPKSAAVTRTYALWAEPTWRQKHLNLCLSPRSEKTTLYKILNNAVCTAVLIWKLWWTVSVTGPRTVRARTFISHRITNSTAETWRSLSTTLAGFSVSSCCRLNTKMKKEEEEQVKKEQE
jgi:hypothetical protein